MRDIKFKCLTECSDEKEEAGFPKIKWVNFNLNFGKHIFPEYKQTSPDLQFTGLKDKNGVEIYEGDVLEYKNDLGRHHLAQIFYKKGGLCFNIHEDDFYKNSEEIDFYESCADMQSKGWIVQFAVIGNIYENPELLNK